MDKRRVFHLTKVAYLGFVCAMLFVWSIPFWAPQYHGYPFSTQMLMARFCFYIDEYAGILVMFAVYLLTEIALLLFISLGTFKNLKWMIPFNIVLVFDILFNLITGNFLGILIALLLIIAGNILARQMEQNRLNYGMTNH